ncbi:hypothetical protein [Pseudomonas sp. SLFW]|uniref:hypothetical protein n=1 Tax=Pseudomonas sp. SLFW TaxID=2683259 RepID=UPI0014123C88|nr:hypothetical protein [Pseudomonas sp. SLFW]NBB09851.1 hypothetical protein [Pseudomonas sp. SLFW]
MTNSAYRLARISAKLGVLLREERVARVSANRGTAKAAARKTTEKNADREVAPPATGEVNAQLNALRIQGYNKAPIAGTQSTRLVLKLTGVAVLRVCTSTSE